MAAASCFAGRAAHFRAERTWRSSLVNRNRNCSLAGSAANRSYHRRIAAYIFGMVRDHGRAEDLTQEVFVSALRRMRATDRPIAFKPWVYEIAKNACIDDFRRARRAREVPIGSARALGNSVCVCDPGIRPARCPGGR